MRVPGSSLPTGFQLRVGNDGKHGQARHQQRNVQQGLRARPQFTRGQIGIRIAREQRHLEEHQAGCPYRGRAAKPREDLLGDDRLKEEQQEGACKNGTGVKSHHGTRGEPGKMRMDTTSSNPVKLRPNGSNRKTRFGSSVANSIASHDN